MHVVGDLPAEAIERFILKIAYQPCDENKTGLIILDGFGVSSESRADYEYIGVDKKPVSLQSIASILKTNVNCRFVVAVVDAKKYRGGSSWPENVAVIFASSGNIHFDDGKVDTFVEALVDASKANYSTMQDFGNRITRLVRFPLEAPDAYKRLNVNYPPKIVVGGWRKMGSGQFRRHS